MKTDWAARSPRLPRIVAITRPTGDVEGADPLAEGFREEGIETRRFPLLRLNLEGAVDRLRRDLTRRWKRDLEAGAPCAHRWLIVTSRNAVFPLGEALRAEGLLPETLQAAGLKVAAVGRRTQAALEEGGWAVSLVPEVHTAEGLLAALRGEAISLTGSSVALPQADLARSTLSEGIQDMGGTVDAVVAYRVEPDRAQADALCAAIRGGLLGGVALTSGSAARTLAEAWGKSGGSQVAARDWESWPPGFMIGVLGPVTEAAARAAGLPVSLTASASTLRALSEEMARAMLEETQGKGKPTDV
jgi:uroporphyrinogen III methyltransferase / synthase